MMAIPYKELEAVLLMYVQRVAFIAIIIKTTTKRGLSLKYFLVIAEQFLEIIWVSIGNQ